MNPFSDLHTHQSLTFGSEMSTLPSVTRLPGNGQTDTFREPNPDYNSKNPFSHSDPTYDQIQNHSKSLGSENIEPSLNISLTNPFGLSTSCISATDGLPNSCAARLCHSPKRDGSPGRSSYNSLTGYCAQATESPGSSNPFFSSSIHPKPQPKDSTGLPRGNGVGNLGFSENSDAKSTAIYSRHLDKLYTSYNPDCPFGVSDNDKQLNYEDKTQKRGYMGLSDANLLEISRIQSVNLPDKNVSHILSKTLPDESAAPNMPGFLNAGLLESWAS